MVLVIHILRVMMSFREFQNQIWEWKWNRISFWKFQYNQPYYLSNEF